jgi:hypothetical protein
MATDDKPGFSFPRAVSFPVLAAVFGLTLAVWLFFYYMQMRLYADGTAMVALVMFGVVSGVKWAWARKHRGGEKK